MSRLPRFGKVDSSESSGAEYFGTVAAAEISAMSPELRFRKRRRSEDFGNVAAAEISAVSRLPRFGKVESSESSGGGYFGTVAAAEILAMSPELRFRQSRRS